MATDRETKGDAATCRALRGHAAALHDIAEAMTVIPETIAAKDVARARMAIGKVRAAIGTRDVTPASAAARLLVIAITLDDAVYMSGVNAGGPRTVVELRAALKRVIEALSPN
jgi:hypothetical protein